jgi:hypothetical protein
MKTAPPPQTLDESGSALALTMIMTGIALAILASAMSWSAHTTRMTHRSIQHTRSVAAAEAGTEKVLSQITRDYLFGGEKLVNDSLSSYRVMVPTSTDSSFWSGWEFNNAGGNLGQSFVQRASVSTYSSLNSTFASLRGFVTTYTVVAHARESTAPQDVVGGVLQEIKLTRIPIFQFAMYSSGKMEISCGQPFQITGKVHANDTLYVEPSSDLTFQSDVSAVGSILWARDPLDTRTPVVPAGTVVYQQRKDARAGAMSLPIGTNNTPEAIREIIQPPPSGESPTSILGRLRYYNQADMILTVSATGVTATSGRFDGFATPIPSSELAAVVTTTNSFKDAREEKIIKPIDINIGALAEWSLTNSSLRGVLGTKDLTSVYVVDNRTLTNTQLGAVRLVNGQRLPAKGLTVATARPLYVLGHYNQTNSANLATTNTTTTLPASIVADAVTILSPNWVDNKSTNSLSSRAAKPTTVNAAVLTGVVETTLGKYSGGMENFPRFLESWGSANALTYNGSMVKMFPSLYATNAWGKSDVYDPPKRNWAYDLNFNDAEKLPPLTPSLMYVFRGQWATVAADKNVAAANP